MRDARGDRTRWCGESGGQGIQDAAVVDDANHSQVQRKWCWSKLPAVSLVMVGLNLPIAGAAYHGQKASPEVHTWFSHLKIPPDYAEGCCGYHRDCWETQAYHKDSRWWALYRPFAADPQFFNEDARFIPIPKASIESLGHLYEQYNLTEQPVLCAEPGKLSEYGNPTVYCFVPPPAAF